MDVPLLPAALREPLVRLLAEVLVPLVTRNASPLFVHCLLKRVVRGYRYRRSARRTWPYMYRHRGSRRAVPGCTRVQACRMHSVCRSSSELAKYILQIAANNATHAVRQLRQGLSSLGSMHVHLEAVVRVCR